MEAYIAAINNYISENKPTVNCPNVDSLLDMLFVGATIGRPLLQNKTTLRTSTARPYNCRI